MAPLKAASPQVLAIEFEEVEGVEKDMLACSNTASPFSSHATASPSIRQECTLNALNRLTGSTAVQFTNALMDWRDDLAAKR
jgi:hypothetical protein